MSNLACIGGDASKVLVRNVPRASVSQVVINFPEPPLWSGGDGESTFHLLTPEFFLLIHTALRKKGTLCILSDNVRYAVALARSLAHLSLSPAHQSDSKSGKQGSKCFEKAAVVTGVEQGAVRVHQDVDGLPLYCGLPGRECGHSEETESYFDRLWQRGNHNKRFFIFVRKVE